MDTFTSTDASAGFNESVLYQDPPTDAAGYLARVIAYHSTRTSDPQPDTTPTANNLRGAKSLLLGGFLDTFCLYDETSRAYALAMMLQPLVQPLISGPTPLYVVGGPRGSEKTTLVEGAASLYDSPVGVCEMSYLRGNQMGRNWRKDIGNELALRPTHFLIEDGTSRLSSPTLAMALSATEFTVRKPGRSETVTLPIRCLWVYTSMKPIVSKDIASRSVNILVARNPDLAGGRSYMLHQQLCANTIQPRLFSAALTLVRAWLEAGQPMFTQRQHRFSVWSQIMGGILEVADIPGFLAD